MHWIFAAPPPGRKEMLRLRLLTGVSYRVCLSKAPVQSEGSGGAHSSALAIVPFGRSRCVSTQRCLPEATRARQNTRRFADEAAESAGPASPSPTAAALANLARLGADRKHQRTTTGSLDRRLAGSHVQPDLSQSKPTEDGRGAIHLPAW